MEQRKIIIYIKTKYYTLEIIADHKRVIKVTPPRITYAKYKQLDWLKNQLKRTKILEEWKEELE